MTADELIERLKDYDQTLSVIFDFGGYPKRIDSWRGSYDQPSLFWDMTYCNITVKYFIAMLEEINGMNVIGYKGGEFVLRGDSEIYLSYNPRDYTMCVIERISKENHQLILHTKYQEY